MFHGWESNSGMTETSAPSTLLCGAWHSGPILWGHSGPLCHALSLSSSSSSSWTSMCRRRATVAAVATPGEWQCKTARSSEWAQHFSNASCLSLLAGKLFRMMLWLISDDDSMDIDSSHAAANMACVLNFVKKMLAIVSLFCVLKF